MEYGEVTKTFLGSGKWDSKGRELGYAVVFRDNGTDFRLLRPEHSQGGKGSWKASVRQPGDDVR
jgi:hypothetical protein